jgi:hypothetical protein
MVDPAGKDSDELEFEDTFDGDSLDLTRWLPRHAGEQRPLQWERACGAPTWKTTGSSAMRGPGSFAAGLRGRAGTAGSGR